MNSATNVGRRLAEKLQEWLAQEGNARSTLAGALVVIEKLSEKCPLTNSAVFTSGGQLIGGRGASLFNILKRHGISENFLRDGVTTRSTEKFRRLLEALDYGRSLRNLPDATKGEIFSSLGRLVEERIADFFSRQHLKVACDRRCSPLAWVEEILGAARDRSEGRVEQHLVGAKLEARLPDAVIGRDSATAGDIQTGRVGDFRTPHAVYHITAAPSSGVIKRCKENLVAGVHPILLVPRTQVERAKGLASDQGIERQISIFAIEDFIAHNIVELAEDKNSDFISTMKRIIDIYNERILEAEVDKSLRIEIR